MNVFFPFVELSPKKKNPRRTQKIRKLVQTKLTRNFHAKATKVNWFSTFFSFSFFCALIPEYSAFPSACVHADNGHILRSIVRQCLITKYSRLPGWLARAWECCCRDIIISSTCSPRQLDSWGVAMIALVFARLNSIISSPTPFLPSFFWLGQLSSSNGWTVVMILKVCLCSSKNGCWIQKHTRLASTLPGLQRKRNGFKLFWWTFSQSFS